MKNFWQKFKKPFGSAQGRPIIALAPMAGITDAAFRYLCGKFGADFGIESGINSGIDRRYVIGSGQHTR